MTALYDIAAEYRDAASKLADLDLDAQTVADTLEGLSGDLEVKAQNVAFFARNLEATAAAIKQAEADMAARRKSLEKRAEGLRQYIFTSMQVAGIEQIECPHFRMSIRDNPAAVEIYEPGLIPVEFMTKPEPPAPAHDKKAIADAIKAGREVAGAKLTQGKRLEIK